MAVRFLVGRAGSGKTYHCLESVRQRLREDPVSGPTLMLLVPEQAALQTERAVLHQRDIPAAHRLEVVSFRRLVQKVWAFCGTAPRQVLSEAARAPSRQ